MRKVGRVVFIRHGESVWNATDPEKGLTVRFTGWADVALTDHGKRQAAAAGRCLKMFNLVPDAVYTSLLRRSRDSFQEMSRVANIFQCPVINSWRLNERHYGALIGMSKGEAGKILGHENVAAWRRSWDQAPPPMKREDLHVWKDAPWAQPVTILSEPYKKSVTAHEKGVVMPLTESLEDCAKRVKPIWVNGIAPRVAHGETVLVVAHANSIRSMIKHIDNETMDDQRVRDVHIPAATPLIYSFQLKHPSIAVQSEQSMSTHDLIRRLRPLGEPSRLGMTGRYVASKEVIRLALQSSVGMDVGTDADKDKEKSQEKDAEVTFFDLIEKGLADITTYSISDHGRQEALMVSDGRGVILHANNEWQSLTGFTNAEIVGRTNRFLQGPLTDEKTIASLDEKLRTGLPARTSVINYRKNGKPFENIFTVIPVYDWLKEESDELKSQSHNRHIAQTLDYSGSDSSDYRQYSDEFMHPSHFIARLEKTPDLNELMPLSFDEMIERDRCGKIERK